MGAEEEADSHEFEGNSTVPNQNKPPGALQFPGEFLAGEGGGGGNFSFSTILRVKGEG